MIRFVEECIANIPPLDERAMQRALIRLDDLTKPKGSLGVLEQAIVRISGMTGHLLPSLRQPGAILFAADHGVSLEGVSAYGAEVTEEMVVNICMGGAVSSVLARCEDVSISVVDVGIRSRVRHPGVIERKVGLGTRNFAVERAMTLEQSYECVKIGIDSANELILNKNIDVMVLGEMGIGNTTAASAMASVLLDLPVPSVVGMGTGISDSKLEKKIEIIRKAIHLHKPNPEDPWDLLSAVGGFEIGAMAGAMIAAASRRIPIILDGVIAGAAALWAFRINAQIRDYFIPSHCSPEPAHAAILHELALEPLVNWGMRLGEGSGALFVLPVLQNACRVMAETSTFADARVSNPHRKQESPEGEHVSQNAAGEEKPSADDFSKEEKAAVYKAIAARRDIRSYLPDSIPEEALERILMAAHMAPSVGYMQPWNFILIKDRTILQEIHQAVDRERVRASAHYNGLKQDYYLRLKLEGLLQAPLTICVTNDHERGGPHVLGRNTIPETDLMSTSCAIENMWLAARVEGIAMGWISVYQKEDIRKILDIPETVDPVALLTVGYTSYFPEIPILERVGWGKRLDLSSLVYQNKWKQPN